jgi:chromosome segregation ATPase
MFLEDVTIEGFKSFSESTSMAFQPGIGVIMGNNGVGKSNILDAMVWALGENDLNKLRCREMDELFFSGNAKYPPADKIRVELCFKESPEQKTPTLLMERVLNKNGQEDYKAQGEALSSKAYQERLAEFHLTDALKTIIRQEQITDLFQVAPGERFLRVQGLMNGPNPAFLRQMLIRDVAPLFKKYLGYLFPEGEGHLLVMDGNEEKCLEVEVAVRGKQVRKAHQISGGEKSITSLALKLALFDSLHSPFYLLDEVEPSLDYTNHKSMQALLKSLIEKKQLIMITHLRSTIELANTLHGVRSRPDGSTFMKFYFVMNERLLRLYKCC